VGGNTRDGSTPFSRMRKLRKSGAFCFQSRIPRKLGSGPWAQTGPNFQRKRHRPSRPHARRISLWNVSPEPIGFLLVRGVKQDTQVTSKNVRVTPENSSGTGQAFPPPSSSPNPRLRLHPQRLRGCRLLRCASDPGRITSCGCGVRCTAVAPRCSGREGVADGPFSTLFAAA
jgi:hypothetical protein